MKKYMKNPKLLLTVLDFFDLALLTGWNTDYTHTFLKDFAFKGSGIDGINKELNETVDA